MHIINALQQIHTRHPQQLAIWDWRGHTLTYDELWLMSKQWAAVLASEYSIGPQDVVGLSLGRSAHHILGVLALWHLNAVALPIDAQLPPLRQAHMIQQTGARLIITNEHPNAHEIDAQHCTISDLKQFLSATNPKTVPGTVNFSQDDLAYIIYTSGSTGTPKGVEVTHRGLVPLLHAQIKAFYLDVTSRVLWVTSPSFDASLSDIGTALLCGATLFIDKPSPPEYITEQLELHHITHIDYPPGLLKQVDLAAIPQSLRVVVIGGEPCPVDVAQRWSSRVKLISVYGPTEATICVSTVECTPQWSAPWLGTPIAGMSWVVLDEHDHPVPAMTQGHLHLTGPGLARGYVGRPDLTDQRFVTINTQRLYRTGDRVVIDEQGRMLFVGRMDRQVKLRGLRIELTEIEHQLMTHPNVTSAVALKRSVHDRDVIVIFYEGAPQQQRDLQRYLSQTLPSWMIPTHIEHLTSIPRNLAQKPALAILATHPLTSTNVSPEPGTSTHTAARTSPWVELFCSFWTQTLHTSIMPTSPLSEHGATSLDIIDVVTRGQRHGLITAPELWRTHDTITSAHTHWSNTATMVPGMRLAKTIRDEVSRLQLPTIQAATSPHQPPKHVFLTGLTGTLGRRLARRWLETGVNVSALVRATDDRHADIRAANCLGELARHCNLHIIRGELTRPRLGISEHQWRTLSQTVDCIVHSAARVHLIDSYEQLKPINTTSLKPLIALVNEGDTHKTLHHISTLSVFVATDQNTGTAMETDHLTRTKEIYGGYAQSKWAAEAALLRASMPGAPVWIYRLGLITGDSVTGEAHGHDFLGSFINGLVQLRSVPHIEDDALKVDITPIDFAAQAITSILSEGPPNIYHIASPTGLTLTRLIHLIRKHYPLKVYPSIDAWQHHLPTSALSHPDAAMAYLAMCRLLAPDELALQHMRTMDLFQATNINFDMTNTLEVLRRNAPALTDALIERYCTFSVKQNK